MPKARNSVNGKKSKVTSVHIYFTTNTELSPHGVHFVFHRQHRGEEKILFNTGSMASWLRLSRLIDTSPGRLATAVNGLIWKPYQPDYFRLDGRRMRQTILDILQKGDWEFNDPDIRFSQWAAFTERVVEDMRHPN